MPLPDPYTAEEWVTLKHSGLCMAENKGTIEFQILKFVLFWPSIPIMAFRRRPTSTF